MGHFSKISLGPLFAVLRKIVIFNTFTEIAICLLIARFSWGFIHSTNLQLFSFLSIPIRLFQGLYFLFFWPSKVCLKNRPVLKIFPWSPLCCLRKISIFDTFTKIAISLLLARFSWGFLHAKTVQQFSIPSILIRLLYGLYFPFFWPSKLCLKNRPFLKNFPWSPPLCRFAKNRHFRHFYRKCYFSFNMTFFIGSFAQHKSTIVQLSIHTNQAILGLVFSSIFWASKVCLKNRQFLKNFPCSSLCCFAKNRHFPHFYRNCYFSSNSSFFMGFFAQHKSTIVQLSIHTIQAIIGLVLPIFLAFHSLPKKSAIF